MTRPLPDRLLCAPPDRRTKNLRLVLSAVAVALLALGTTRLFDTAPHYRSELVIDYKSSVAGIIQVFYDVGNGIREADSSRADIQRTDHFQEVRLKLGAAKLTWLRLDPLDRMGSMVLAHLRIVRRGEPDIILAPQSVSAVQQIGSINMSGDEILIQTVEAANDPILRVTFSAPIRTFRSYDLNRVPVFLGWSVIWTVLIWIIQWIPRLAAHKSSARATTRRQGGLVIAAALSGTMIACGPIIFLHQSLLAPSAGMFYDSCPTIPGQTDCRPVDFHMSDIGAMMWAFFPNAVVQERAIKQFGEFPLWNRYDSAGVSMIGQGQMMLGDPLTWLQWLIGVDAASFDMKFVILRVVFAAALGLSVLTVTESILPSVIVGFAAPFVGFFVYRVNHPAIFSLCYAPLISLAWLRLTYGGDSRKRIWSLAGLMVANWLVLNSGTVKEAYVVIMVLNIGGSLLFVSERRHATRDKFWPFLLMLCISGVCFVVISLPIVGVFFDTLMQGRTNYDAPGVEQLPVWQSLIFVDTYFSLLVAHQYFAAVNALLIAGFCAAILFIREFRAAHVRRSAVILALTTAIGYSVGFSVVPTRVLLAIPFINGIYHDDTTFATVLVVPTTILAGLEFHLIEQQISKGKTTRVLLGMGLAFLFLCFMFVLGFAERGGLHVSSFLAYAPVVLACAVFTPWFVVKLSDGQLLFPGVAVCVLAIIVVLGRGAVFPEVRLPSPFFAPDQRTSLVVRPPIVNRLETSLLADPARVIGLGDVLVPGYNGVIGLETISGPDAVMVRAYRQLTEALHLPYNDWQWRMVFNVAALSTFDRALDLLNVRYVLASVGLDGLPRVDSDGRVSVYRRDTAWPRAFFSKQVVIVDDLAGLAGYITADTRGPFVAIERSDKNAMDQAARFATTDDMSGQIVNATDYALSCNSTSFTIRAPAAGVAYLGEANTPGEFEAFINGKRTPYFTANEAFKGIKIPGPGTYRITFAFWPAHLTGFLAIAAIGAGLWTGAMALFWLRLHREGDTRSAAPRSLAA